MSRLTSRSSEGIEAGHAESGGSRASAGTPEEIQARPPKRRRRRHGRPPDVEKEWYSKAEAARYLGVAEITITRYLQKGLLQAQRLSTPGGQSLSTGIDYGRLRIHRRELDRYLESLDRHPIDAAGQNRSGAEINANTNSTDPTGISGSDFMTREEAALRLGVSWRTIKRYLESGKLRLAGYFRCPDSYTRAHVYRSEVEKLLPDEPRD